MKKSYEESMMLLLLLISLLCGVLIGVSIQDARWKEELIKKGFYSPLDYDPHPILQRIVSLFK